MVVMLHIIKTSDSEIPWITVQSVYIVSSDFTLQSATKIFLTMPHNMYMKLIIFHFTTNCIFKIKMSKWSQTVSASLFPFTLYGGIDDSALSYKQIGGSSMKKLTELAEWLTSCSLSLRLLCIGGIKWTFDTQIAQNNDQQIHKSDCKFYVIIFYRYMLRKVKTKIKFIFRQKSAIKT